MTPSAGLTPAARPDFPWWLGRGPLLSCRPLGWGGLGRQGKAGGARCGVRAPSLSRERILDGQGIETASSVAAAKTGFCGSVLTAWGRMKRTPNIQPAGRPPAQCSFFLWFAARRIHRAVFDHLKGQRVSGTIGCELTMYHNKITTGRTVVNLQRVAQAQGRPGGACPACCTGQRQREEEGPSTTRIRPGRPAQTVHSKRGQAGSNRPPLLAAAPDSEGLR